MPEPRHRHEELRKRLYELLFAMDDVRIANLQAYVIRHQFRERGDVLAVKCGEDRLGMMEWTR
jgi:hypothetical protein